MKVKLSSLLGIVGALFLLYFFVKEPFFVLYFLFWSLPGLIVSYNFKIDLTFLERFSISLALSNVFLILFRLLTILKIPFGKSILIFVSFILPIALSIVNYKFFISQFKKFKFEKASMSIFIIAVAVFLVLFTWGPLLQDSELPLTDQVVNQAFIVVYQESIEQDQGYPFWTSEYSGGFPIVLFDSPFYYEKIAITDIIMPSPNLTFHMNYYSFYNFTLLLVGIFCLSRRIGWSKIASIIAMIFFITSPLLVAKCGYSGDMKELSSFAILPVMLIVYFLAIKSRKISYFIFLGLLVVSYYFTNLSPFIPSFMMMVFYFLIYKILEREKIKKGDIIGFSVLGATIFALIAFQMITMFLSMKYGSASNWDFTLTWKGYWDWWVKPIVTDPVLTSFTPNSGLWFSIVGLAGMIWSILHMWRTKSKEYAWANYLLIAFWLAFLSKMLPLTNLIMKTVESQRLLLLILLIFSIFIARLFDVVKKISVYHIGVLLVFLLILIPNVEMTKVQTENWVNEGAQNGLFGEEYKFLEQYGPGRAMNFGVFAYATESYIPALSNLWMISHTTAVGARTTPQVELKDRFETGINQEHNITYVLNRMRTTFTRHIIVIKNPGRGGDVAYNILNNEITPVAENAQIALFVIPNSTYIHSVIPVRTDLSKEAIYSQPEGWKVFVLNDSDVVLESAEDIQNLPDPVNYQFQSEGRGEIDIYGDFNGEWIVVKDHYFPTWRAYMNGEEIEIKENNLGTLLIKTGKGDKIHMSHKQYKYEQILAVIAAIVLLGAFLYPVFSKK